MSIHNRYADVPLTEEDFTNFDAQFAIIEQMMSVLQEPDGRILRRVAKLGMKSDTFTRDALMLAAQHEELLPRGLDVEELKAQVKLRDTLKSRALAMKLMAKKMEKIVQLLGSDVFSGALAAYKAMKTNHRGTLNEELRELGRIFRRGKKGGEEVEVEGLETRDDTQRESSTTGSSSIGGSRVDRQTTDRIAPEDSSRHTLPEDGKVEVLPAKLPLMLPQVEDSASMAEIEHPSEGNRSRLAGVPSDPLPASS